MPSITMKTLAAGPHGAFRAGETYTIGENNLTEAMARAYETAGSAVYCDDPVIEIATAAPPTETADANPGRQGDTERAAKVLADRKKKAK